MDELDAQTGSSTRIEGFEPNDSRYVDKSHDRTKAEMDHRKFEGHANPNFDPLPNGHMILGKM